MNKKFQIDGVILGCPWGKAKFFSTDFNKNYSKNKVRKTKKMKAILVILLLLFSSSLTMMVTKKIDNTIGVYANSYYYDNLFQRRLSFLNLIIN
jgi:hypothetical protein